MIHCKPVQCTHSSDVDIHWILFKNEDGHGISNPIVILTDYEVKSIVDQWIQLNTPDGIPIQKWRKRDDNRPIISDYPAMIKGLQEYMQTHKIDQEELANLTDILQPELSRLLAGRATKGRFATHQKIVKFFAAQVKPAVVSQIKEEANNLTGIPQPELSRLLEGREAPKLRGRPANNRSKVFTSTIKRWIAVADIAAETGLTKKQIRGVLDAPDSKNKFKRKVQSDGLTLYHYALGPFH